MRWMHYHSGGLVDDEKCFVLVNNIEWNVLGLSSHTRWPRDRNAKEIASANLVRSAIEYLAIDLYRAGGDSILHLRARAMGDHPSKKLIDPLWPLTLRNSKLEYPL